MNDRIQRGTCIDEDELLEAFEAAWGAGSTPDVFQFVERCPRSSFGKIVAELIQIDMERRWRADNLDLRRGLLKYLEVLPPVFTNAELVDLICGEYRIRNQWGDCISRKKVWENDSHVSKSLLERISSVSDTMDWPTVSIVVNGHAVLETRLDREIEAGRQQNMNQAPWSVSSNPFLHRINLSEAGDATISRNQLAISRCSPAEVLLHNISSNRAIAVRGRGAIDFGEKLVCKLPVFVHLGATRYLRISTSAIPDAFA